MITKRCPIGELVGQPSDCTNNNKPGHHCCYLSTTTTPKLSMCMQLSESVYNGLKTYSLGGVLYDIECGYTKEEENGFVMPGTPCGETYPNKVEDCKEDSKSKSSCCLYKDSERSGCYHIGIKHTGKLSIWGMSLEC